MKCKKQITVSISDDKIIISQETSYVHENGTMDIFDMDYDLDIEETEELIECLKEAIYEIENEL